MSIPLQDALVRIWSNTGEIWGAGFLATNNMVLTCAHVVSDALALDRQATPATAVQLDFPFISAKAMIPTTVQFWQPRRADGTGDIAGLVLQAPKPSSACPLRLVSAPNTWNHPFHAFGFPNHRDDGVYTTGILRDKTVNGYIQVEDTKATGYPIQPGFSGTPVWDDALQGVIGMVALAEPKAETRAAFIIPADVLLEVCPDLRLWAMPPNPYRGLHAFRHEDAKVFFGRESFVEQLKKAVDHKPFVAVIGPSGSGKSSVVSAGLLPKVGKETAVFQFRPGSPNNKPFHNLVNAMAPLDLPPDERQRVIQILANDLQMRANDLTGVINDFTQRLDGKQRVLLIAEQFEELYTLYPSDVQEAFIDCLVTAVHAQPQQYPPRFTLLLTMRADFWGQATANRRLADILQDGQLILGPMTREELARAIMEPARVASVQFEGGLAERILDDVGDEPGNLPLLEFALTLLWEKQANGYLTHKAYESIGEVEGALASYADDIYSSLEQKDQERVQFIFTQLVQPGRGTEDTRRQATIDEIGEENWGLVTQLANARLVVTNINELNMETVELVHEILIRRWQRLRDWMNAERLFREWQERLRDDLSQWEEVNQDDGGLLRGLVLVEAEKWLEKTGYKLQKDEREFIYQSIIANDPGNLDVWIPRYGNKEQILKLADAYLASKEDNNKIRGIKILRYITADNDWFDARQRLFQIVISPEKKDVQNQAGKALFEMGYAEWCMDQLKHPDLKPAEKANLIRVFGFLRNQPRLGMEVENHHPGKYKGKIQTSAARQLITGHGSQLAIIIAFAFLASELGNEVISQILWTVQDMQGLGSNITHIFDIEDLLIAIALGLFILCRAFIDKRPISIRRALLIGFTSGILSNSLSMIASIAKSTAYILTYPGADVTFGFFISPIIDSIDVSFAMAVFVTSMRMFYSRSFQWKKAFVFSILASTTAIVTNLVMIPFLSSIVHQHVFDLIHVEQSFTENFEERIITLLYGFFICFTCVIGFRYGLRVASTMSGAVMDEDETLGFEAEEARL
jgi:energy-coupling factor transporter ATP-binding protein EcfA2